MGYLLGYIVGIIAEMLLEAFATGGAAAVAKAIHFIQNFAKGSVKFIRKSGICLKEEISTLSSRLSHLFQSLRDGTAIPQLKQWIDDILTTIKKELGISDEVLEKSTKYDRIYRVQRGKNAPNISKFRFMLKNNKVIIEGDEMLHVTFNDEYRVAQFWTKRGDKVEVFAADIDNAFIEKIKREAVFQEYARAFPNRPQIDNPTKTNSSFGIPKNYFEELLKSIKNPEIIKQ